MPQLLVSRETSLATGAAWLLLWRELELVTTEDGIELSGVQEQLGAHSRSHSTSLPGASIKPQGGPRAVESSRCTSQKPFCISFCGMFPPNKEAVTTLSLPAQESNQNFLGHALLGGEGMGGRARSHLPWGGGVPCPQAEVRMAPKPCPVC